jgi:hypothetical protein
MIETIQKTIKPLEIVAIAGVLGINAFELRKIMPLPSAFKRQNGEWDAIFSGPFWNSKTQRDPCLANEILGILVSIAIRIEESLKPVKYDSQWLNVFY